MGASTDLFDLCSEYLEACREALVDTPLGIAALRYYVAPHPPAWDTIDQLTVHVGAPALADTYPLQPMLAPGHRVAVQGQVELISLTATILRGTPFVSDDGRLPSQDDFNTASAQTCADLWSVWNYVKMRKRDGTLFAPLEREFFMDPAVSLQAEGGACGWQIPLRVQLSGYKPAAVTMPC